MAYQVTGKCCTSGSSGIAAREAHIKNTLTNAAVINGYRISGSSDLDAWLESL